MKIISCPQYNPEHLDLVKFGLDMTKKAQTCATNLTLSGKTESITSHFQMPSITYPYCLGNLIEIVRRKLLKGRYIKKKALVDRKTGLMADRYKGFSDIYKFDQHTFPDEEYVNIIKVGYWNTLNQYVARSNKNIS